MVSSTSSRIGFWTSNKISTIVVRQPS
jgi:hypothetical protein